MWCTAEWTGMKIRVGGGGGGEGARSLCFLVRGRKSERGRCCVIQYGVKE